MSKKRTERGFRLFAEAKGVNVIESSLALEGAHVRVYGGRDIAIEGHEGHVHLNVEQAEVVVRGLTAFITEARAGELTEPDQWPGEEGGG